MAAAKKQRIQSLESLFPIIPTDLRELVSSWLPPAREPSPEVDECAANIELNGRQERLALGATISSSQQPSQFQNRMNRKMGITLANGFQPGSKKIKPNESTNARGKRKTESSSDSEEDSKSRLVSKLSSKKSELVESIKKKEPSRTSKLHQLVQHDQVDVSSSATSTEREKQHTPVPTVRKEPDHEISPSSPPSSSVIQIESALTQSPHTTPTVKPLGLQSFSEHHTANGALESPKDGIALGKKRKKKKKKRRRDKELKRRKLEKLPESEKSG